MYLSEQKLAWFPEANWVDHVPVAVVGNLHDGNPEFYPTGMGWYLVLTQKFQLPSDGGQYDLSIHSPRAMLCYRI